MEPQKQQLSGFIVHQVLAYSYLVYFAAVCFGFLLDLVYAIKINVPLGQPFGFLAIALGTWLIVWAQSSSKKSTVSRAEPAKVCAKDFCVGPYVFSRSPTHYGLFFMTLGLALLYSSVTMVALVLIAFVITRTVFLPQEEKQLELKYGEAYLDYKKQVRL
jgi:protein-S-isoprenylcysteine O-methyltransferase Ste14